MATYIWTPEEFGPLTVSGEAFVVGVLSKDSYADCLARAKEKFANPRLVITIVRKENAPLSKVAIFDADGKEATVEFNPGDMNYPILEKEWARFQADEPLYCRIPCLVIAVDKAKYTVPLRTPSPEEVAMSDTPDAPGTGPSPFSFFIRGRSPPTSTSRPSSPEQSSFEDLLVRERLEELKLTTELTLPKDKDLIPGSIHESDGRVLIHFAYIRLDETGTPPDTVRRSIGWTAVRDPRGACYLTFVTHATRPYRSRGRYKDESFLNAIVEIEEGLLDKPDRIPITSERFEELLVRARYSCAINRV